PQDAAQDEEPPARESDAMVQRATVQQPLPAAPPAAAERASDARLLAAKVALLRRPSTYPAAPVRVEVNETHLSWLFFAGDAVYKLKKPMCTDVVDYRTLEARQRCCAAEVTLNEALAPGVYLGVSVLA